jgi:hypothetical protein
MLNSIIGVVIEQGGLKSDIEILRIVGRGQRFLRSSHPSHFNSHVGVRVNQKRYFQISVHYSPIVCPKSPSGPSILGFPVL